MSITIITKEDCVFCEKAKTLLRSRDILFEEIHVGKDVTRDWILKKYPHIKSVPIIFDGAEFIGGYQDLMEKLSTSPEFGKTFLLG